MVEILILVAAHVAVRVKRIFKMSALYNTKVGQPLHVLLACRNNTTNSGPSLLQLLAEVSHLLGYHTGLWNSSCTVMQAQDVDPVTLRCWASATDLCTRACTIYVWLTLFMDQIVCGLCV